LKKSHKGFGDTLFLDELFVKINGKQYYLWRVVDQESLPHERSECFGYGEVVDVYLQSKRNGATAKRFFKCILRRHGDEPRNIVTDKLRSYGVAHRELMPDTTHNTEQYANNRAEQSQSLPRFMGMRRRG
jgi:putative transposase